MAAVVKKLIALAPYFPQIWPVLVAIFGEIQKLGEIIQKANPAPVDGGLALTAPNAEDEADLNELAAALGDPDPSVQAFIDLTTIRTVLTLARQYPEVMLAVNAVLDWLLTRLGKVG